MSEEKEENIARTSDENSEIGEIDKCVLIREKMGIEPEGSLSLEGTLLVLTKRIEWLEQVIQMMYQQAQGDREDKSKKEPESRIFTGH